VNISQHVKELIVSRLRERRIIVWYDADKVFHALFEALDHAPLVKVDASRSRLHARREADRAWRALFDIDSLGPPPALLLIYVAGDRGDSEDARRGDLFESFALAGSTFGATDAERLPSIARQVLVGRDVEVDRLFAEGTPTLVQLDALAGGTRYPLLHEAFGTDVPARVAAKLLCRPDEVAQHLASTTGLVAELRRLLLDAFGFGSDAAIPAEALAPAFAQWILFSEFVFDLAAGVPASVTHVPRAEPVYRRAIYDLCQDLRGSAEHRDAYRDLATEVERRLGFSPLAQSPGPLGERDTFPFEDRAALLGLQQVTLSGGLAIASRLAEQRRKSVWRLVPERDQLWRLAERCLDLLKAGADWQGRAVGAGRPVADHVRAYCAEEDGLWRVDQAQRLLEQAAAMLVDRDTLAPLLDHVRRQYRTCLGVAQDAFMDAVSRNGWPAEGYARQTQGWSRHAEGAVRDGRRTAWFLVDALRYEMGRELAARLAREGTARVEPACGVVPAATPFGMAALLPGADTALTYGEHDGTLVPLLSGRPVVTAEERRDVFTSVLGDRFASIRLGQLLTASTAQLRTRIRSANVLGVFSTEIDDFGEHSDPLLARRYISEVVGDLLAAASRLVELGFERLVFAADHGFMQLPELLPGDRCTEPAGNWLLRTRRSLLGELGGRSDDVVTIAASLLAIQGPIKHVCVPRGVKVFRMGSPYFHEGISLQECLVPFVVLDAVKRQPSSEGTALVSIHYRSDRFTTRIFSVQVGFSSIERPAMPVRVQAFVPGTEELAGEPADCEARDPHTGLVTLSVAERVHIPIALNTDFHGDAVEVRVVDAMTPGRTYASLVLRNATLE
jgi:hypothetical protein